MKTALFVPCFIDQFFPRAAEAVRRVLTALGHDVIVPEGQTCCGQPSFNAGHWPDARRVARHFLQVFAGHELIVAPSGSCVAMVKSHYPQLFPDGEEARTAQQVGERIHEFTSFLTDVMQVETLNAHLPIKMKVTLHDSCHAHRDLGIYDQPRRLLGMIEGLQLVEMADSDVCCGFGGVFSVKYPEVSTALADAKLDNAAETGAEIITAVDGSCLIHLQGRLERRGMKVRTMHIAELIAEGMGLL